jgi:hypothetical protein
LAATGGGRGPENEFGVARTDATPGEQEIKETSWREKLGRLEANVEMLVGDGQPGRMKLAEDKIFALQRSEIRRGVYDRIVSAVIATVVSALIALHESLWAEVGRSRGSGVKG